MVTCLQEMMNGMCSGQYSTHNYLVSRMFIKDQSFALCILIPFDLLKSNFPRRRNSVKNAVGNPMLNITRQGRGPNEL